MTLTMAVPTFYPIKQNAPPPTPQEISTDHPKKKKKERKS
jgi:hypothetical protein